MVTALWTCVGSFFGSLPMIYWSIREVRGYRKLAAEVRDIEAALEASAKQTQAACDHVDRATAFLVELARITGERAEHRAN